MHVWLVLLYARSLINPPPFAPSLSPFTKKYERKNKNGILVTCTLLKIVVVLAAIVLARLLHPTTPTIPACLLAAARPPIRRAWWCPTRHGTRSLPASCLLKERGDGLLLVDVVDGLRDEWCHRELWGDLNGMEWMQEGGIVNEPHITGKRASRPSSYRVCHIYPLPQSTPKRTWTILALASCAGVRGMVLSTTTSSSFDLKMRSLAGPEKSPCDAKAYTRRAAGGVVWWWDGTGDKGVCEWFRLSLFFMSLFFSRTAEVQGNLIKWVNQKKLQAHRRWRRARRRPSPASRPCRSCRPRSPRPSPPRSPPGPCGPPA